MIKRLVSLLALIALIFTLPCYAYATECKENVSIIVNEIIETAGYGPGDYFVFSGIVNSDTFYHSGGPLTLYLDVKSADPGTLKVQLISASSGSILATGQAVRDGLWSINYMDRPAGNYYFRFISANMTIQYVKILGINEI